MILVFFVVFNSTQCDMIVPLSRRSPENRKWGLFSVSALNLATSGFRASAFGCEDNCNPVWGYLIPNRGYRNFKIPMTYEKQKLHYGTIIWGYLNYLKIIIKLSNFKAIAIKFLILK